MSEMNQKEQINEIEDTKKCETEISEQMRNRNILQWMLDGLWLCGGS